MDAFQEILRLSQSPKPEDQARSVELYNSFVANEQAGRFLLQFIGDPACVPVIHQVMTCLRAWVKHHWSALPGDAKVEVFVALKNVIVSGSGIAKQVAETFVDLTKALEDVQAYEPSLLEIFRYLQGATNPEHLRALMMLVVCLCKRYERKKKCEACEPVFIMQKVVNDVFPLFGNQQLLGDPVGCEILSMCLSSYKSVFMRCRASLEDAVTPRGFAMTLLGCYVQGNAIPNLKLVSTCVRFVVGIMNTKWTAKACSAEDKVCVAKCILKTLEFTLQHFPEESYLVSALLLGFSKFLKEIPDGPELGMLLLNAAKLTQRDEEEFSASPSVFYASLYSKTLSGECHPRSEATALFSKLMSRNPQYAEMLLSLGPDEHVMRCIGVCVNRFKEGDLRHKLLVWVTSTLKCEFRHPIIKTAQLFLLCSCVKDLDIDVCSNIFHGDMVMALRSEDLVLKAMACKLFIKLVTKAGISPEAEIINILMDFTQECPTPHAGKAISVMAEVYPEYVLPRAGDVISNVVSGLSSDVAVLSQEQDNDDVVEQAESNIESNLDLLAEFMKSCGKYCVPDFLLECLMGFLRSEMSDFFDHVAKVCLCIVRSESPRSPDVINMILATVRDNELAWGFSSLLEPISAFIGTNPEGFLALNVSEAVIDLCMNVITKTDGVLDVSCLISFVVFVDPRAADKVLAFITQLASIQNDSDCMLDFAITEMSAAAFLSKKAVPDAKLIETIRVLETNGCIRRISHHYLFAEVLCLITIQMPQLGPEAMQIVAGLMTRVKSLVGKSPNEISEFWQEIPIPPKLAILEVDWTFPSPYQKFDISGLISEALSKLPPEAVQQLKSAHPAFFA